MTAAGVTLDEFLGSYHVEPQEGPGLRYLHEPPGLSAASSPTAAHDPEDAWNEPLPRQETPQPQWICFRCEGSQFGYDINGWICEGCGSRHYYNSTAPTRRETSAGTWVYVPREAPQGEEFVSLRLQTAQATGDLLPTLLLRQVRHITGPPSWTSGEGYEQAESEVATTDVTIDPDNMAPLPRLSRRQRRAAAAGRATPSGEHPEGHRSSQGRGSGLRHPPACAHGQERDRERNGLDQWRDDMLKNVAGYVGNKEADREWNSRKGPMPGIKYRGGAPPAPPPWSYNRDDLRAYDKWERKVRVWELQVSSYLPKNEAAMMLYVSLRGEAEEELEHCDKG